MCTPWRSEIIGCFWTVKLDVRDFGGNLDVTRRALAGTLRNTAKQATCYVIGVGALTTLFQRMLGMVCSTLG